MLLQAQLGHVTSPSTGGPVASMGTWACGAWCPRTRCLVLWAQTAPAKPSRASGRGQTVDDTAETVAAMPAR